MYYIDVQNILTHLKEEFSFVKVKRMVVTSVITPVNADIALGYLIFCYVNY